MDSLFTLPSLWNLIISTIVFSIAAKYVHRHLHERGIPEGKKRNLWVLAIASLLSWGAGEAADWTHEKIEATPQAVQATTDNSHVP
ncbi:MAG: hypothetical protein KGL39_60525, partial [Patescibacteria group bacterium]|nr:hypothetical protein [Patescibacteria group bacterium]